MSFLNEYYVELDANEFEPVGLIRRSIALIVDFIICSLFVSGTIHYISVLIPVEFILSIIGFGGCVLYFGLLQKFSYGQTLGKRMMGIAVIPKRGGKLTWMQAFLRMPVMFTIMGIGPILFRNISMEMVQAVTIAVLVVNAGLVVVTRNKRSVHDYIFNTYVVKTKMPNIITTD